MLRRAPWLRRCSAALQPGGAAGAPAPRAPLVAEHQVRLQGHPKAVSDPKRGVLLLRTGSDLPVCLPGEPRLARAAGGCSLAGAGRKAAGERWS